MASRWTLAGERWARYQCKTLHVSFLPRTYKSRIRHVRRCKTHISALKTLLIYMLIKYMPGYPKIQYERHMINSQISYSLPNKLIKFKEHLNERSRTSFIYKKKKLSAFLLLKALVNGNIFSVRRRRSGCRTSEAVCCVLGRFSCSPIQYNH